MLVQKSIENTESLKYHVDYGVFAHRKVISTDEAALTTICDRSEALVSTLYSRTTNLPTCEDAVLWLSVSLL